MDIEKVQQAISVLAENKIPGYVASDMLDMCGFDGCECQAIHWFYSPSTKNFYRKEYGCGTGTWRWAEIYETRYGRFGLIVNKEYENGLGVDIDFERHLPAPDDLIEL